MNHYLLAPTLDLLPQYSTSVTDPFLFGRLWIIGCSVWTPPEHGTVMRSPADSDHHTLHAVVTDTGDGADALMESQRNETRAERLSGGLSRSGSRS